LNAQESSGIDAHASGRTCRNTSPNSVPTENASSVFRCLCATESYS
jgi:hypothetical protein